MPDRILSVITTTVLVLAGSLIISSALGYVVNLGNVLPLEVVQFHTGSVLICLSIILSILNLWLTKHSLYEYWLVVMIGGIVGAIYLT